MKSFLKIVSFALSGVAFVLSVGCHNGRWRAAPPDESTFAPKDGTPVVKLDSTQQGATISVNTDSEFESYVIDKFVFAGVVPKEMPIIIGALTPGLSTRIFVKFDFEKFQKAMSTPGEKKWTLHRKVVWKSGKTADDELSGTIVAP